VLVDQFVRDNATLDLKNKASRALKMVLQKCTYLSALDPLLKEAPEKIVKYVVAQYAKVLPNNVQARKNFVASRGLARVLEMKSDDPNDKLQEYVATIAACYPPDIVQYFSPNYSETIIKRLDDMEAGPAGMLSSLSLNSTPGH